MSAPLVTNPNDPEQVAKAEEKERIREKILAAAWRDVLSMPVGRHVIHEILKQCGRWSTPGVPGDHDMTWAKIGQQSLGIWIDTQIDLFHADALWQMKQEEKKRMEA